VASSDIGLGNTVQENYLRWQTWPAAAAGASCIRNSERPDAIRDLTGSIARAPFSSADPIRKSKLIKANGSGYMAAILPSGMRTISGKSRPRPQPADSSCSTLMSTSFALTATRWRKRARASRTIPARTFCTTCALYNVRGLAIDQTVEEKNGQRVVVGKTATELVPHQQRRSRFRVFVGSVELIRCLTCLG
jgi:pilus assembly protein CpaB